MLQAVRRVEDDDVSPMPPDKPLPPEAVAALTRWVAAGAPWPVAAATIRADRHWAFEPVRAVEPPAVPAATPIDAFLAAAQRKKGLTPAGPADKRTLIRRATFDLTGLPPDARGGRGVPRRRRAGRLRGGGRPPARLAPLRREVGPAWLDVARYADTAGETADFPVPDAWRYRNYVIDALNADKPYDQFLREQIAGDLLAARPPRRRPAGPVRRLIAATGYLAVARRFGFEIVQGPPPDDRRHDRHLLQERPRPDGRLRPLPRPQVRPDQRRRLLRPLRDLRQHALSLPRLREGPRPRATTCPSSPPPSKPAGSEPLQGRGRRVRAGARRRRAAGRQAAAATGRKRWRPATSPTAAGMTSRADGPYG